MINFNCTNCGQKINVPVMHAGKKGKCPKCKTMLVIPLSSGNDHKDLVPNIQFEEEPINHTAEGGETVIELDLDSLKQAWQKPLAW